MRWQPEKCVAEGFTYAHWIGLDLNFHWSHFGLCHNPFKSYAHCFGTLFWHTVLAHCSGLCFWKLCTALDYQHSTCYEYDWINLSLITQLKSWALKYQWPKSHWRSLETLTLTMFCHEHSNTPVILFTKIVPRISLNVSPMLCCSNHLLCVYGRRWNVEHATTSQSSRMKL